MNLKIIFLIVILLFIKINLFSQENLKTIEEFQTYFSKKKNKELIEGIWVIKQYTYLMQGEKIIENNVNNNIYYIIYKKGDNYITYFPVSKEYSLKGENYSFIYDDNNKNYYILKNNKQILLKIIGKNSLFYSDKYPNEFDNSETELIENYFTRYKNKKRKK